MSETYHHGDLKPALIEAARELLRKEGADALSLRGIAAAVGVSHMAPYAHFKNKKELLQAVAAAGFDELTERMMAARKRTKRNRDLALNYGIEYINFALENPEFYRIMLSQVDPGGRVRAGTARKKKAEIISAELRASSQRPFQLLYGTFANRRTSRKEAVSRAIGAWSLVHGMAALVIDGHLVVPQGMNVIDIFKASVGRARGT